jgi:hypothetical protein
MARYQLKPNCIFVDANDPKDKKNKKPDENPYPHVFNQTTKTYVAFNDAAGFIARFIVLGVDTKVISQILVSEYGSSEVANLQGGVDKVYAMMKDYLENRPAGSSGNPDYYKPPVPLPPKHSGKLKLNFSTNPIGYVNLKTPTS